MAEGATNNAALVLKSIPPLRQPSTWPPRVTSIPAGFNARRFVRCALGLEAGGLFVVLGMAGINAFPVERLKLILVEEFGLTKGGPVPGFS